MRNFAPGAEVRSVPWDVEAAGAVGNAADFQHVSAHEGQQERQLQQQE